MYVWKLLEHMQWPYRVQDLLPISLQKYTNGWRKAQEATSSSLSGNHFGHYMAGSFNPDIVLFDAMMVNLPMKTGYSPQHWQEGLNVMLEKTWELQC